MAKWWIRFGCFLTGYNYNIIKASSEVSSKALKKYTSAILIVCIIWGFIGYMFTQRYFKANEFTSIIGGLVMVIIIIQIERQIVLSFARNTLLYVFRAVIAIMMAGIGSIIIDQIIFKEDIELEKITFIERRVKEALPPKTSELNSQIYNIDSAISKKELERLQLIADVNKNPTLKNISSQTVPTIVKKTLTDPITGTVTSYDTIVRSTSVFSNNVPNPKQSLILPLEQTIAGLRKQKSEKDSLLLNIRPRLENEIKSKVGFLDELKVMAKLLTESKVALFFWLIWFLFLFGLELFVLISKLTDRQNDYDETVKHQMNLQIKKLQVLEKLAQGNQ